MKILAYFAHPSQYQFLKYPIQILSEKGHKIDIIIKQKDCLETLVKNDGHNYFNILPEGRKSNITGIALGLLKREIRLYSYLKHKKYDLFIGADAAIAHIGRLKRTPVITFGEDDIDAIPLFAKITFPFTTHIVTPENCNVGKYAHKKIAYNGLMKLAYVHPNRFTPDNSVIQHLGGEKFFLLRLSKLDALHDFNIKGISTEILIKLIATLKSHGKILISSEKELGDEFKDYAININPSDILSYVANAEMLISDGQSMISEAALLGVPSLRFNDFVGKIGVIEELEHKYQLTYGIKPEYPEKLFAKLNEMLTTLGLKEIFMKRRQAMLKDKIDVTAFMVWLMENYPESARIMKSNPDYQYTFK